MAAPQREPAGFRVGDLTIDLGTRQVSRAVRYANEDELLARVLITSWSLATGRTLRGVPPQSLTEDELISFWADDHIPAPRVGSG